MTAHHSNLPEERFLTGLTALVTGGCSGIGLATAHKLASFGAAIAVGSRIESRDKNQISDVRSQLLKYGQDVCLGHLDVRDSDSIDSFIAQTRAELGTIDILINCAGITAEQGVVGHSETLWHDVLETNLSGPFRLIRSVLPDMIEHGWGRIVNIGSTAATVGWKDNPAYCASKAGLLGLTRCVALEGAPHGVSCVMISPTWVDTKLMRDDVEQIAKREERGRSTTQIIDEIIVQNPQNRLIQPDEIASTVIFLCREDALGLSMNNIQITGGALW